MSLILLAGGKSTRLNTDKAFLEFNNKTIISESIEDLKRAWKAPIDYDNMLGGIEK